MLEDLDAAAGIATHVDTLLRRSSAYGRFPTPVGDIVAAAGLTEAPGFSLDEAAISLLPPTLRATMRKVGRRLQGALDRRERVVHVNEQLNTAGKKNFVRLHEVAHDILPHQHHLVYADDNETLSPSTRLLFEQEANQGAAELLFQRTTFAEDGRSLEVGTAAAIYLAQRYGSSLHASFRRYAETHKRPVLVIRLGPTSNSDGSVDRFETPCSTAWLERFGPPQFSRRLRPGRDPIMSVVDSLDDTMVLSDRAGHPVTLHADVFDNSYSRFLMLWVPRKKLLRFPVQSVRLVG